MPPPLKSIALRAAQVLATFVLFSICNALAVKFEVENGISLLFPATAISIIACMQFGVWAAIGIVLGTIATPWSPQADLPSLTISGIVSAIEGLIPYFVFRWRHDLARDLRDMRSFLVFLLFGTLLNTGFSAIAGNLFVVNHPHGFELNWREVFVWWIADFTAALLLATPILAFGGHLIAIFRKKPIEERPPRTIVNSVQILIVIVLLGCGAAYAMRAYLSNVMEDDRAALQRSITAHQTPDAKTWNDMAEKRHRITVVALMVDGLVIVILLLASATLLGSVSRPFAQIRSALEGMREGEPFAAERIHSNYDEIRSLADAMSETSTTLRRREEELRLQTERAVAASRHKSEFLAKMSHELRTPLNSIIGFSDLLTEQDDCLDAAKRLNFLDNVTGSARHLLSLINDLLDIAKVESGKMTLELQDIDLRQTIARTVATTAPLFGRKKQEVEVSVPDEPMLVRADAGRVEQVLLNLLSNANKFSPEGEKITVATATDSQEWKIEVRDHGIGISREDQQRIFDDFEQVHATGSHSRGTGLGLALAKRFMEAHGGVIEVQSDLGQGSVFRIRLPKQVPSPRGAGRGAEG